MDLERFKAALQERKFEGYLFEQPPSVIATDIRRMAAQRDRELLTGDIQRIGASIMVIALLVLFFIREETVLARAGILVLMAASAIEAVAVLTLRIRFRTKLYHLPARSFLLEERRRVKGRIWLMQAYTTWLAIPLVTGFIMVIWTKTSAPTDLGLWIGFTAVMLMTFHLRNRRTIRRELLPELDAVNRELADLDAVPDVMEG